MAQTSVDPTLRYLMVAEVSEADVSLCIARDKSEEGRINMWQSPYLVGDCCQGDIDMDDVIIDSRCGPRARKQHCRLACSSAGVLGLHKSYPPLFSCTYV